MQKSKGFTIIELLVVVAIIAVLTGIVLVNVTSYINKGKDAAVQGNLANMAVNATLYFVVNGNYTNWCTDSTTVNSLAAADRAFDGNSTANQVTACNATSTTWAACGQLKSSDVWFCIDSTGVKKTFSPRTTCVTAWVSDHCG